MTNEQIKHCREWHRELGDLINLQKQFYAAYREALSGANPSQHRDPFQDCRECKIKIKKIILDLRKNVSIPKEERKIQLEILKDRFDRARKLVEIKLANVKWEDVEAILLNKPHLIRTLIKMEKTGGAPRVLWYDRNTKEFIFVDCSINAPDGRRGLCYDRAAQTMAEKAGLHPKGNIMDMAAEMGIEVLDTEQYKKLQQHAVYDLGTECWIKSPDELVKQGKALRGKRGPTRRNPNIEEVSAGDINAKRSFRGFLRVKATPGT